MRKIIFFCLITVLSLQLSAMPNKSDQMINQLEQQKNALTANRENKINQYKQSLESASKKKIASYKKKIEDYKNKRIENFMKKIKKEKDKRLDQFIEKLDKQIATTTNKIEQQIINLKQKVQGAPAVTVMPAGRMTAPPIQGNVPIEQRFPIR